VANKECTAISVSQQKLKQRDNTPPAPKVCTNSSNVARSVGIAANY